MMTMMVFVSLRRRRMMMMMILVGYLLHLSYILNFFSSFSPSFPYHLKKQSLSILLYLLFHLHHHVCASFCVFSSSLFLLPLLQVLSSSFTSFSPNIVAH